jgi:hypothetical protein
MKTAIELIAEERARQLTAEGYTHAHDDEHTHGQIAAAALCYTDAHLVALTWHPSHHEEKWTQVMMDRWPWGEEYFQPRADPIKNLVKAGALIAAEIERLQRLQK